MLEKNKIEIQSGQIINKMGGGGEEEGRELNKKAPKDYKLLRSVI